MIPYSVNECECVMLLGYLVGIFQFSVMGDFGVDSDTEPDCVKCEADTTTNDLCNNDSTGNGMQNLAYLIVIAVIACKACQYIRSDSFNTKFGHIII